MALLTGWGGGMKSLSGAAPHSATHEATGTDEASTTAQPRCSPGATSTTRRCRPVIRADLPGEEVASRKIEFEFNSMNRCRGRRITNTHFAQALRAKMLARKLSTEWHWFE